MEYERVKEKFKQNFGYELMHRFNIKDGSLCEEIAYCALDQILSLVEIKSEDQNLPEIPDRYADYQIGYEQAQQDMSKAGFIRVIPKPKGK